MGDLLTLNLSCKCENELLDTLLNYESHNGKFLSETCTIQSQWMHIHAQERTRDILTDLIIQGRNKQTIKTVCIFREGLFVSKNVVDFAETSTLILCSTLFEAIQWYELLKSKCGLKILLIKGRRKNIPKSDVYITSKHYFHLLLQLKFYRIIFFYDFCNRTLLFEKCKFSYSPISFEIVYQWQKYQTFTLVPDRKNYIKPKLYTIKHSELPLFNFKEWTFASTFKTVTDSFQCPICKEYFKEILRLQCRHNICNACFKSSYILGSITTCPICRALLFNTRIYNVYESTIVEQNATIQQCIVKCMDYIKQDKYVIFKEDVSCSDKDILKFRESSKLIFNLEEFPECDMNFVEHVIIVQEKHQIHNDFTISFLKSFCSYTRTLNLNIYLIHSLNEMVEKFTSYLQTYFQ